VVRIGIVAPHYSWKVLGKDKVNELELISEVIKLKDRKAIEDDIIKTDVDIFVRKDKTRLVLSLLLSGDHVASAENDEVVLEITASRNLMTGSYDITDSFGSCYFSDAVYIDKNYFIRIDDELDYAVNKLLGLPS
jgi:hypothetical protein